MHRVVSSSSVLGLQVNYQDTMPMFREYGLPHLVFMDGNYDKVDFRINDSEREAALWKTQDALYLILRLDPGLARGVWASWSTEADDGSEVGPWISGSRDVKTTSAKDVGDCTWLGWLEMGGYPMN
jgi:hypothetical protein